MEEFVVFTNILGEEVAVHWTAIDTVIDRIQYRVIQTDNDIHYTNESGDTIYEKINVARKTDDE